MPSTRYETVSFLSDYGLVDEFVGVVHSVIASIAPHARVIDITHGIARHDTRAGGLALARACQYLRPGVVLGVVDPGVGTDRRAVAIEVGGGQSVLVGPDNGLLAPAVALVGGATRAVVLDDPAYHLPAPGPTFDGRDLFAPCAAHLCAGVALTELGSEIDVASLQPGLLPVGGRDGDAVTGEVLWVDHFGNLQLNLDPADVEGMGASLLLESGDLVRRVDRAATYATIPAGGVGMVVDSHGLLSLAVAAGSAADVLGLGEAARIRLVEGGPERTPAPTPVELSSRPSFQRPPEDDH